MDRLTDQFGDQIEFVILDFDVEETQSIRRQYGITGQAQYLLVDAAGEVQHRWYGVLDEATVSAVLTELLEEG